MPSTPTTSQHILELLKNHHLVTAPHLLDLIHQTNSGINKTTVYRALDALLTEGKVCRQHLTDNHIVYELRNHHHDHLVCTKCGSVSSAESQLHIDQVGEFKVDHHHVTLYGICAACQHVTS